MASLKEKSVKGFLWAFSEKWAMQFVNFGVAMVLARLLTPTDYGTVALLTIFISVSETLVDSGFGRALVQKKDVAELDFNSAFYISVAASLVLYSVMFFAAPFIARFYDNPELVGLLRVLSISIICSAVNGVQNAELNRSLLFHLSFRISLISCVVTALAGLSLAYCGYGPWALVISSLGGQISGVISRWYFIAWRPQLMFSFAAAKGLWSYGWKLAVSSLLDTIYNNLSGLIIGKLYTKADLAYVNKGHSSPALVMGTINGTLGRVAFPALSKVQDDVATMRKGAKKFLTVSEFWVMPLMVGCGVCAPRLVPLLFGDQWYPAIPYMQLSCFSFALWPFHTVNLQVIMAKGRSDYFLYVEILKKVFSLLVLVVSYRFGVFAMMAALILICDPFCVLVNAWPNRGLIGYSPMRQIRDVLPTAFLALLMGVAIWPLGFLPFPGFVVIILQMFCGAATYLGISYLVKFEPLVECLATMKQIWGRK